MVDNPVNADFYRKLLADKRDDGTINDFNHAASVQKGASQGRFTPDQLQQLGIGTTEDPFEPSAAPQEDYSIQAYLDSIGWDGEQDKYGRDAQRIKFDTQLHSIDSGGFGFEEDDVIQYFDNLLPQQNGTVIRNGMAPDGGQIFDTPTGNAPPLEDPVGNEGVDTSLQPDEFTWDRGSKFSPDPFQPSQQQADMGWDWSQFNQQGAPPLQGGGGSDPNDYAFDRYVPGQESPWGIPQVEGGNRDFYRNQFVNLLRGEQNFQNDQRTAQDRRQFVQNSPLESTEPDWSWANLPEVETMDSGYAAPLPGQGFGGEDYGYQEGGAAFTFNPAAGGWAGVAPR